MKRSVLLSILFASFAMVAAVTVTAQPQGQGQGRSQGTSEEMAKMMVERMSKELDLSEEQEEQIYEINVKAAEERGGDSGSRPSREEMEAAREKIDVEIKKVLSDSQIEKYDEMQSKMRERGPRQQ